MADMALSGDDVLQTDDDIVAFNQAVRRKLVRQMMADDKLPEDNESRTVLLKALADSDRAALTNKKIGSTEKQGAADRQAALIIAAMSQQFGQQSPFEAPEGMTRTELPRLDSNQLPVIEIVEGETEIGLPTDTYDTFIERMDTKTGFSPAKTKAVG